MFSEQVSRWTEMRLKRVTECISGVHFDAWCWQALHDLFFFPSLLSERGCSSNSRLKILHCTKH